MKMMTWMAKAVFCMMFSMSCSAEVSSPFFDGPRFASLIPPDPNDFASIDQLQDRMADGQLTSVQLVSRAFERIEVLNHVGPQLNAVIETNPDALSIAASMDEERAQGLVRGPLHGVPVLIKDNIDSGDRMQTSAGSLALLGVPATRDAFVVERLRQAGAVLLGKANTSEWAGFRDWEIPLGWSGRGGQTRNPWGLDISTGGSSSGPAAALAAGFAPISVGTETNGSIILPAYANSVVGMRPTHGMTSISGLIPLSLRQDTPGPLARTVRDAALLMSVIAERNAEDPTTHDPRRAQINYTERLDSTALRGKRLGYPLMRPDGSFTKDHPEFIRLSSRLERAGAVLVPIALTIPELFEEQMAVLQYDFKRELATYLNSRNGIPMRNLAQVIAFNKENPGQEGYGQSLLEITQASDLDEAAYQQAVGRLLGQSQEMIDSALSAHSLDVLIDFAEGDLKGVGAQAGYPGLTVPAGLDASGHPFGLYFSGRAWSDSDLLSMAYAFEQTE